MTWVDSVYRVSYYAGVQTVRLLHRLGRFFSLVFLPLLLWLRRLLRGVPRAHKKQESTRSGGLNVRRRLAGVSQQVSAAWRRHPLLGALQVLYVPVAAAKRYRRGTRVVLTVVALGCALALLTGTFRYWGQTRFALALTDESGDVWGYVAEEAVLHDGMAMATERAGSLVKAEALAVSPAVSLHIVQPGATWDKTEVCDRLLERTELVLSDACGLYINGVFRGAFGNRRSGQRMLDDILEESCADKPGVTASFFETVELVDGLYPESTVYTAEAMKERVLDTEAEEHLSVLMSGTIQYEAAVPFTTRRVEDASLYKGTERVRVNGENGINLITATATYLDGEELSCVITASETIKEPVTQVVAYGTKNKPSKKDYKGGPYATGRFIWPVTCTRYVHQPYSMSGVRHRGIDIWKKNMTGEEIVAADGGRVVIAAERKGTSYWSYGKYVVIDHGGGYQTLYAHCSELLVQPGDIVKQGQRIALVGNTGRSTSPHLHFEVQVSGRAVNPLRYY